MRLIDADALKSEMLSNAPTIVGDGAFYKILDLIDNTPTIESWIPVEERLPKKSGWYAVTVKKYGRVTIELSKHVEGEPWCADNAVAWMPLPKPYEVKNNDV